MWSAIGPALGYEKSCRTSHSIEENVANACVKADDRPLSPPETTGQVYPISASEHQTCSHYTAFLGTGRALCLLFRKITCSW